MPDTPLEKTKKPISLGFSIQGEFITNLAREKFYQNNDLSAAIELLTHCLVTDALSKWEITGLAVKVLNGEAELRGTYPGENYGYFELKEKDPKFDIARKLKDMQNSIQTLQAKVKAYETRMSFIQEELQDYSLDDLTEAWDDCYDSEEDGPLFYGRNIDTNNYSNATLIALNKLTDKNPTISAGPQSWVKTTAASSLLDSYMKRMRLNTENDYGWLAPDGTFYPVEWGEHQTWAYNYLDAHPYKDWDPDDIPSYNPEAAGDCLIRHNWRLLHNPAQGLAEMSMPDVNTLTDKQRDFLIGYWEERKQKDKVREIYRSYNNA